MAGPLCHLVRDYVGADSGSIFWVDKDGHPAGFYHDCAPAELKEVFIANTAMFTDPDEITMLSMIHSDGPAIGRMLDPAIAERFRNGNVQRYLCAPLGHDNLLEITIRRYGRGHALICLWNPRDRDFTHDHAKALEPLHRLIERAAMADESIVTWRKMSAEPCHFITDLSGHQLIAIHPEAETLMMDSHLLRQRVSMTKPVTVAPVFAGQLAAALSAGSDAALHLPIANGRLVARASLTRMVSDGQTMMYVALQRENADNVLAVEYVMALPLTALQREIALFAMTGGARADCPAEFGVSDEALKKHLRPILQATGTSRWADLPNLKF